jgi:hypothetical protein
MAIRLTRTDSSIKQNVAKNNDGLYYNKYSEDLPREAIKCRLIFDGTRWKTISPSGSTWTAKGLHVFVVQRGILLISKPRSVPFDPSPIGHLDLAGHQPIEFGGEIKFGCSYNNRGVLLWWNDRTGHFNNPSRPMDPSVVPELPQAEFSPYLSS